MRTCKVCGCYVPEGRTSCPACGGEELTEPNDVKVEQGEGVEICYRADGTFYVRQKQRAKRSRKTPPVAD